MIKSINHSFGIGNKRNARKTTIELTKGQHFFLKEKTLQHNKQNQNESRISIIRDWVEKDQYYFHIYFYGKAEEIKLDNCGRESIIQRFDRHLDKYTQIKTRSLKAN